MATSLYLPELRRARYAPFLGLALVLFLMAWWVGTAVVEPPPSYGMELLSNGYVDEVDPGGAAARAGLRVGDRVLDVDGVPLFRQVSLVQHRRVGDWVHLTVQRGAAVLELGVVLGEATPRARRFGLELLLVGLVFWVVGFGVWLLRPADRVVLRFFLLAQAVTGLLFAEALDPDVPGMILFSHVMRLLPAPLLLHFCCLFPDPLPARTRQLLLACAYGLSALMALLTLGAPLWSVDVYAAGLWHAAQALELVLLGAALAVLFRSRANVSQAVRRRRRVLVAGMLLGIAPVLAASLSRLLGPGIPHVPFGWAVPLMVLVPLAFAYAVFRGELGQVDFLLNRSLVYALLTVALMSLYALLYLGLEGFLPFERPEVRLVAGAALFAAGGAIFVPLRTCVQRWVDRIFYGGWYDYRTFVRQASAEVCRVTDQDELVARLQEAMKTMHFKAAMLLWNAEAGCTAWGGYGFPEATQRLMHLPAGGVLLQTLRKVAFPETTGTLSLILAAAPLTAGERSLLACPEIRLWVPLVHRETLHGVLLLGEHTGDHGIDREDLDILATLSEQAAVACEKVTLLGSLRERLAEVERMRDELAEVQGRLAEGREEERLHLARELHDGPVQDLLAMGHGLEGLVAARPDEDGRARLKVLHASVRHVAEALRDICTELRPPLLADFGLAAALEHYVGRLQQRHPVVVELCLTPAVGGLTERVQLALFRICQEALNNAVQHGRARHIHVQLERNGRRACLRIHDDGCGFTVPARWVEFGRCGHFGLLGIAERAAAVGGTLHVRSAPGEGTRLRVDVPALFDDVEDAAVPRARALVAATP